MNLKYCSDNHSKHLILLHVIFVFKYRNKLLIRNDVKNDVEQYAYEICNKWNVEILQMNTDKNHIHFMLRIKPTTVINKLVDVMKQYITFHIWQKYSKYIKQYLWKEHTLFTDGYFVSSIGTVSADKLNAYIEEKG